MSVEIEINFPDLTAIIVLSHTWEFVYNRFFCIKGDGSYSSVYKVKRREDGALYALKKVKI